MSKNVKLFVRTIVALLSVLLLMQTTPLGGVFAFAVSEVVEAVAGESVQRSSVMIFPGG